MAGILTVVILIISILLALAVLVQNSKGGGLASGFQSSGQMFGVRRTTDFLEKATWGLASALIVFSIMAGVIGSSGAAVDRKDSVAKQNAGDTEVPAATQPNQPVTPNGGTK